MIPHRLQFSGIRDFRPSSLDLSGDGHVMITGPNGAGKSTLTFCMGAALYSSKVDVEGLKSRNLPPEQVWKAHVSLLFKNDGPIKIDEPTYIQFTIMIVQDPGQPIKREFIVQKGEQPDEWDDTLKYTSGDRYHNFTQYTKDLQFRYKIHPDLFYLIWYQQEVNQFAVMNSEERFRIFSEMHGIDKMQKNWEESIEKVKDADETMRQAEQNMIFHKQNLSILKTSLNRYLNNQQRLRSGALQSLTALHALELRYNKEINTLQRTLVDLREELEKFKDKLALVISQQEESANKLERLEDDLKYLDQAIRKISEQIEIHETELKEIVAEEQSLTQELKALIEREKRIDRTEEQANDEFDRLTIELSKINREQNMLEKEIAEKDTIRYDLINEKAQLQNQIVQEDKFEKEQQELLNQFESSFKVQERIDHLNKVILDNKDILHQTEQEIIQLTIEKKGLEEGRNVSIRQQQSIDYFKEHGIEAFPLRELIELDDSSDLADENRFNAIKYTIFFNGKTAYPPNDLYHVPLMNIVPDRWQNHLPKLRLKVKNNLSEDKYNHAVKALYWISQFFHEKEPRIHHNVLIDSRGIRGQQEKHGYILSHKAIQIRLNEVANEISHLESIADSLKNRIENDTEQFQLLNSEIQKVKEAEAFMIKKHERVQRKKKLTSVIAKEQTLHSQLINLQTKEKSFMQTYAILTEQQRIVQKELNFYKELGQSKEKYERLHQLRELKDQIEQKINDLKFTLEKQESSHDKLTKTISRTNRIKNNKQQELEDIRREQKALNRQLQNYQDRLAIYENELVLVIQHIQDMKNLVPNLYEEFITQFEGELGSSEEVLKNQLENAMITFNNARNEEDIDPAAEENYKVAKAEFERLDNEFQQSKVLLEADIERTEQLKADLETTINMRVLEIQKRFIVYMGEFQFQGDISWKSIEDKRGRTHFHLYIKARKEGHRGDLVDVGLKARGGKVGKGVSGGEESLSSLLFALALLQNVDTAPGFIVLDEFDSALDEHRKSKVFDLYVDQLQRKLIILTPKTHEEEYIDRFNKAFVVQHDPREPRSKVTGLRLTVND